MSRTWAYEGKLARVSTVLPTRQVPWHEGAEYASALSAAGAPARSLIYNHVLHSDYVMSWKPKSAAAVAAAAAAGASGSPRHAQAEAAGDVAGCPPLKDFARDFLKLMRGCSAVKTARTTADGSSVARQGAGAAMGGAAQQVRGVVATGGATAAAAAAASLEGVAHLSCL